MSSRRSARSQVARRNRGKQSQGEFPVGLAVGIGVGVAGLLIAVAVVLMPDTDSPLIVTSDSESSKTSGFQKEQGNSSNSPSESDASTVFGFGNSTAGSTTNSNPVTQPDDLGSSPPVGYQPPPQVASKQGTSPSMTSFSGAPDTSGLPSSNGSRGGVDPSQPTPERGSPGSSASNTASDSGRPPVLESWVAVDQLVGPSVVRVDMKTTEGVGNGSGFVIDAEQGIAVTNYHVVEGSFDVEIAFENGDRIDVDGYLYLDHERDIALIKFDPSRSTQAKLRALPLADAYPLRGEDVAAFGAPIGLDFSMTQDIVSAIRSPKDMETMLGMPDAKGTWIQHGVPISPGNSGGPLVNKRGEVVGINTMHLVAGQNLNFAISGLDISDAFSHQLPKMLAVNPGSAPIRTRSSGSGPEGSFDDPYERPDIQIVDISGEDRGLELLAKMKSLSILSIAFSDDPSGTVTGAVRTEARKTIDRCKIKLTTSRDADYVMLMVMQLERSGNKNTLRMTSQILTKDDRARQVLKIWELSDDVGTISLQSIYRAYLPPVLKKDIQKYFATVRSELIDARRNYSPKDEDEKKK